MIEGNILYGSICGYTLYRSIGPATLPIPHRMAGARPSRPRLLNDAAGPVQEVSRETRLEQLRIRAGMTRGI
jgi:hypothetical protein